MKQTAVEWLIDELKGVYESDYFNRLLEQAKQMEKEQIIDFADSYGTYLLTGGTMTAGTYNETFKSE
jgi:hypothetical protein